MKSAQAIYRESCGDLEEMNDLAMQQLPEVYYQTARIAERLPRHVDTEDLVQAGVVGLLEACRSYNPSSPASFQTFAKFRIRGAILDSLRKLDWGSRAVRRKSREVDTAVDHLRGALGREPSEEEVAKEVNLSIADLQALRSDVETLVVLGQEVDAPDSIRDLIETAPAPNTENPFELCASQESRALLAAAVAELDEREQTVLSLYYREEMTGREIGQVLGLGGSRVSQIHTGALAKLRERLARLKSNTAERAAARPIPEIQREVRTGRTYECIA